MSTIYLRIAQKLWLTKSRSSFGKAKTGQNYLRGLLRPSAKRFVRVLNYTPRISKRLRLMLHRPKLNAPTRIRW